MTRTDVITATYRVNTPLFLGGANNNESVELRLPSFKGALRFWWRALVWDQVRDVDELRRREAELFGSSDGKVGQSKVRMQLEAELPAPLLKGTNFRDRYRSADGLSYLGYGVMNFRAQLERPCLPAPFTFAVKLRFHRGLDDATREQVIAALKLLGLLGSIGSKSRKGYGSLTLLELTHGEQELWSAPTTLADLEHELRKLGVVTATSNEPEYTAFSRETRIVLAAGARNDSPESIHDRLGRELVRYRAYGRNGQILGRIPAERNFVRDHDMMYEVAHNRGATAEQHSERIAFGLPHNYFFSTTGGKASVEPQQQDRRASPLFLHVHQVPGHAPIGVVSFLPARFLPPGERVNVKRTAVPVTTNDFWGPVTRFLDRMLNDDQRKEPFAQVKEVARG